MYACAKHNSDESFIGSYCSKNPRTKLKVQVNYNPACCLPQDLTEQDEGEEVSTDVYPEGYETGGGRGGRGGFGVI